MNQEHLPDIIAMCDEVSRLFFRLVSSLEKRTFFGSVECMTKIFALLNENKYF